MSKSIFAEFACDIMKIIFDTNDQNNYVTMVYKVTILFFGKTKQKERGK
jgi:hypothetical protein